MNDDKFLVAKDKSDSDTLLALLAMREALLSLGKALAQDKPELLAVFAALQEADKVLLK